MGILHSLRVIAEMARITAPTLVDMARGQVSRETIDLRALVTAVRDDERFTPSLLPVGDGLLVAVLRARG